ncbi:MAG: hypothetical protein C0594_05115 [Marinilabiliales bacterium]|nr:MAG: hypothetical protein C0594_05115 [Marinilabiliales bacterium]
MDAEIILNAVLARYESLDRRGIDYYLTIDIGHNKSEWIVPQACYSDGDTGVELLKQALDSAIEKGFDYIWIKEYRSRDADADEIVNGEQGIKIELDKIKKQETQADRIIQNSSQRFDKAFEGFGGVDNYFETQRVLMKNDYEILVLKKENEKLENENRKLQQEVVSLEKENSELAENCEDIIRKAEEMKKYVPGNIKIFGTNPIPLGAAILERTVKNYAMKNPETVMKFTGLSRQELAGILQDEPDMDDSTQMPQQPVQDIPVEQSQVLSEDQQAHLQVASAIFNWCRSLNTGDLKKVHEIFAWIYLSEGRMQEERTQKIIEFINQKESQNESA